MFVRVGPEIAADLTIAEAREWLVTNGIGGYASGTVAGSLARGYHGLLVAAVHPPTDRRLMLVKLEETVTYRGRSFALTSNRWASGDVAPRGHENIESFALEGSIPCWRFACADALIEKRIWMEHGANTTYVAYTVLDAAGPVHLTASAIVDNRVFHNTGQVAWPAGVEPLDDGVRVRWDGDTRPLVVRLQASHTTTAIELFRDFLLPAETARGLHDRDDHVHVATLTTTIAPGQTVLALGSAEDDPSLHPSALDRRRQRDEDLLDRWRRARAGAAPAWLEPLVVAADQFIVDRPSPGQPDGKSVIAGYHWFGDWGRDTMISLPGLALVTGRPEIAAPILETFARYVSEGMLPNRFPDAGDTPEYNTIDATLWYFQAIRAYHEATGDDALLRRLYPTLTQIIAAHVRGTRYGIHVDPADGLLAWAHDGVQLTWMDARVGDRVITPRMGKPVEVNALWLNALSAMVAFAEVLGEDAAPHAARRDAARQGFQRFWNPEAGYCFDVLDGPAGHEAHLRPNQLFAIALPDCPLSQEQCRGVLDACARALLTPRGLASLDAGDPAYRGIYRGGPADRDGAYHQGTVWAWLIGTFVDAHLRVHDDPRAALRFLEPFRDHLLIAGLGTVSEIFEGNAPHWPRGAIAQAWSVAEILRAHARIAAAVTQSEASNQ